MKEDYDQLNSHARHTTLISNRQRDTPIDSRPSAFPYAQGESTAVVSPFGPAIPSDPSSAHPQLDHSPEQFQNDLTDPLSPTLHLDYSPGLSAGAGAVRWPFHNDEEAFLLRHYQRFVLSWVKNTCARSSFSSSKFFHRWMRVTNITASDGISNVTLIKVPWYSTQYTLCRLDTLAALLPIHQQVLCSIKRNVWRYYFLSLAVPTSKKIRMRRLQPAFFGVLRKLTLPVLQKTINTIFWERRFSFKAPISICPRLTAPSNIPSCGVTSDKRYTYLSLCSNL